MLRKEFQAFHILSHILLMNLIRFFQEMFNLGLARGKRAIFGRLKLRTIQTSDDSINFYIPNGSEGSALSPLPLDQIH